MRQLVLINELSTVSRTPLAVTLSDPHRLCTMPDPILLMCRCTKLGVVLGGSFVVTKLRIMCLTVPVPTLLGILGIGAGPIANRCLFVSSMWLKRYVRRTVCRCVNRLIQTLILPTMYPVLGAHLTPEEQNVWCTCLLMFDRMWQSPVCVNLLRIEPLRG